VNADEWREIRQLRATGMSIKGVAVALHISRNTVRRALSFDEPPDDRPVRRSTAPGALLDGGPAARTGTNSSIPAFATEFIGRGSELHEIRTLLGGHRLVTISGVGGVGKTRLAAQVASDCRRAFTDGVRFVELAALRNGALVPQAVFDSLGMAHLDHPERSVGEAIVEHLRSRRILIVLDNCEHILHACTGFVDEVLRATSRVRFLTTSREVLDLPGEMVTVLRPLPVGAERSAEGPTPAAALFESRARDILSDFRISEDNAAYVRQVCERLDGLPLAIELACARLRVLSVRELARRLDDGFELLSTRGRGGQQRHQSLQAAMTWSHDLCTPEQRLFWARASIFAGGFDVEMAESVCSDDALPVAIILDCIYDLVGKSILQREESRGRVRFRILETIREYGLGMLTEAETARLHARHLECCSHLVATAVERWFGDDQIELAERLSANLANLRTALQTALTRPGGRQAAVALVAAPWFLWACGLSAREHTTWLRRVLEVVGAEPMPRARVLMTLGLVQTLQGDRRSAQPNLREALVLAEEAAAPSILAFATDALGLGAFFEGDLNEADTLLTSAVTLYEALPDASGDLVCTASVHLGMLAAFEGRTERAAACFDRVRTLCEAADEKWMLSYAVYGQGLVALTDGRYPEAVELARASLRLKQEFKDSVGTPLAIDLLGWAEAGVGCAARAATLLGAASTLWGGFGQQLYGSEQWLARRVSFEERAREELGDATYDEHRARGASLTLPELMDFALDHARPSAGASPDGLVASLSPRERQVAAHLAQGLSNKEIAAVLVLSHRTIEGHVERILQKLDMTSRGQVALALAAAGQGVPVIG
jgi:predicted ATPase/DNA-binding CsgD family transcriptional regulator